MRNVNNRAGLKDCSKQDLLLHLRRHTTVRPERQGGPHSTVPRVFTTTRVATRQFNHEYTPLGSERKQALFRRNVKRGETYGGEIPMKL